MSSSDQQFDSRLQEDPIEVLCDKFDHMWANSQFPEIDAFLPQVDPSRRNRLLKMLISIDVEYRIRKDGEVDLQLYSSFGEEAVAQAANAIQSVAQERTLKKPAVAFPEIHDYQIEKKVGEGGMGTVYLAEQRHPVRRQVAVKVVKSGYDSADVVERFQAERQALALMDHPNIAKVLDAGSTVGGSPYFAMEFVEGVPITRFCDQFRLTIAERVAVFLKVCRAVQHAHQKGIIHRDLKPTNILVSESDAGPVPKIIDFGLAKAMEKQVRLTEKTILTSFGTIVGSPQYMSPEQAELGQTDIDTRTDVYSLGAVFYELLTGTTPIEANEIRNQTPLQTLAAIREHEPISPSSKLSSNETSADQIAQTRKSSHAKLKQMFRGELDWIAMKALEQDRNRRYETVEAFQNDLQCFLSNEPVKARPPSSWYLLGKVVQKHRALMTTLAVFFVLLMTTTIIIANLYLNEKVARSNSEEHSARAKYFSAIGFWERNQTKEAVEVLHEVDEDYRFVEWYLAQNQFEQNCVSFGEADGNILYSAVLSPDGSLIASTGMGGIITIWNVETGEIVKELNGKCESIQTLSIHPNGELLASGDHKGRVKVWNLRSEEVVFQVTDPNGPIRCLTFSHDGKRLAIAGGTNPFAGQNEDGECSIRILDVSDPTRYVDLKGHEARVNKIAFSQDDSRLLTGSRDKTVRVWDTVSGAEVLQLDAEAFVLSVAYSPLSDSIVCGTADNRILLWKLEQDKPTLVWQRDALGFEGDTVDCISFRPDGSELAMGGFDGTIRVLEVEWGNETKVLRGHHSTVFSAVYSNDSRRLLSASEDGTVKLWDMELESESKILQGHTQSVNAISFSPNGRWLLSGSGKNENDATSSRPNLPDDNSIRLWDMENESCQQLDAHLDSVTDVEFNPNSYAGRRFASSSLDGTIRLWSFDEQWTSQQIVAHGGKPVHGLAFHPKGSRLVSAGSDHELRVWEIDSGREVLTLSGHQSPVTCVAWSPDGKWIASSAQESEMIVWDAATGQKVWQKDITWITSLAFSPDSLNLVSGSIELNVWDVKSGEEQATLSQSRLGLYFASFLQDADVPRLLIGGRQGQAWLFDAETWEELMQLDIDSPEKWNFVYDGKFSPDGSLVATANRDGTIRIWHARRRGRDKNH